MVAASELTRLSFIGRKRKSQDHKRIGDFVQRATWHAVGKANDDSPRYEPTSPSNHL
jgi:hypothetical protein